MLKRDLSMTVTMTTGLKCIVFTTFTRKNSPFHTCIIRPTRLFVSLAKSFKALRPVLSESLTMEIIDYIYYFI